MSEHAKKCAVFLSIAIAFIAAVDAPLTAFGQSTEYQALITDIQGTALVKRAGKADWVRVVWGVQLYRGDELKIKESSSASLLFRSGSLITLGPGSSLIVAEQSLSSPKKNGSSRAVDTGLSGDLALLTMRDSPSQAAGALAGLRAGSSVAEISAVSPRNTKIKTVRPSFTWTAAQKFESFTVTLLTDAGAVWKRSTSASQLEYPTDLPELERGKRYVWYVESDGLFEQVKSASVAFTVLSAKEMKAVEAKEAALRGSIGTEGKSASLRFLLGTYYDQSGLWEDAIVQFSTISSSNPDAPLSHEILGRLYEKVDLKDQAIKELQKAVELGRGD